MEKVGVEFNLEVTLTVSCFLHRSCEGRFILEDEGLVTRGEAKGGRSSRIGYYWLLSPIIVYQPLF